jgi:CHAT domain-containing protein/tetratricopeptide (TPR) repeat protein
MARSTAQSGQGPCPNCGRPVPLEIWLIVDIAERPDLAGRIRDDRLHTLPCPHCGHEGEVDAPLLVHDPERRRVFFAPPRQTSEEEDRQLAQGLLGQLAETFVHPRPEYLNHTMAVSRELLPAVLDDDDPQAALEAMTTEAVGRLEELRRDDPETYRQLAKEPQEAMAGVLPLLNTLQAFIQADTWPASRQVVEAHPELLSDETDALLGQLIGGAQDQGDENAVRVLGEHRALLRRCREEGIEAAFAGKSGASPVDDTPPEARAAMEALAALPPNLRDALAELMGRVSSTQELEAALAEEPELRAALDEAMAGLPGGVSTVPPEFQTDLRRAQEAEGRYRRSGDRSALDEAAACWRRIWDHPGFTAAPQAFRLAVLNDGGGVFLRRYWASGQMADLTVALGCWEEAVAGTPEGSPDLPGYLNNLGNGLRARYARTGDLADLARAIEAYEEAVAGTPEGSPDLPSRLNNLGNGLRARYARTGDLADLARAIEAYETTCRWGIDVAVEESLRASRNWGNWASTREEWEEATQAFDYGLVASERLFRIQLLRTSKEAWLREARGLHARAAYALAKLGDLSRAAEVLEQGRARLLSQVLERDRAELSQLEQLAPAAYQEYAVAVQQLQILEAQDVGGQIVLAPGQTLADALRQARADLDVAVEAIRQVSGYDTFLQPLTFAQIQAAALPSPNGGGAGGEGTPLVYLAVTPSGALALIVRWGGSEPAIIPLWLDDLTEDGLREQIQGPDDDPQLGGYLGAYARWRSTPHDDRTARAAWLAALDTTTRWLWDVLVGPLVETLTGLGLAHAVLIPQGWLGLLPLHAAWTEIKVPSTSEVTGTSRRYALDDVCFSYAPNARALLSAHGTAARVAPDRLLAVDEPWPVSANPLPNSAQEVAAACEHFPADQRKVLGGEAASEEAVRALLPDYPVLHFSCHGLAGFARPLEGGLVMAHDQMLTLGDILSQRLDNARLAVLSACETGVPGTELPDEVVALPTGLVQAGVAGVVASLWSVSDLSTMMLMGRFYNLWQREGLEPAEALRGAQRWVRDTTNGQKAEYFKGFLPEFSGQKMPLHVADTLYKASIMARPDENDFEHAFFWGAFGYTGT